MAGVKMSKASGLLIMLHCEQFTGYAIGILEAVFFEAAKKAGYAEQDIYWSYKSVSDDTAGNIIACDYRSKDYVGLTRLIKEKNIRQVIAFDLNYPSPAIKALRTSGIKHIVSYWGAGMSSINSGLRLQLKRLEWLARRYKPDHFIFESEAMRATATRGRGVPPGRTDVVPLGVDTTRFTAHYGGDYYAHNALNIPEARKLVFYSGHMEERKGVRVIVQAAIELIDRMENDGVHFVLCGNKGDEALVYQNLLENTRAKDHVTFAGYRQDIAALMRSSFVGVIASTGWDSFTMSSVEMMASGLPLIVSNLQGLAETIENNTNGFHIEPGNYKQLAERINYLYCHPEKAATFSTASRTRAVTFFSKEQQIEKIAHLLSIA
jgi:glycosyltransferase involved in cell wall biosynthesis